MKRLVVFTLSLIVSQSITLKAVDFTNKEKSVIYTNAIKVLNDYQSGINQMGIDVVNNVEKARNSAESLLELFVNRQVLIYNDLDPSHKLSEFYEAETYTNNIILWYPDGITINLDLENAMVSDIVSHDATVYSIDILTKKSINGNYLNQTLNKNIEELTFRIAFSLENKVLGDFRIVGIRNASSNYLIDYTQALKEVNIENFTEDDLSKIKNQIKTILKDYSNFLSLLGDPQERTEDKEFYKSSFLKLFPEGEPRIYNDIAPEPESSLISVNDYITAFISDYPNGIRNLSINSDSANFGKVMKSEDGRYYTYTYVDKFFSGNYKGKEVFRKMFPLIFKISFTAEAKVFSNFQISSIDISSVNFYEATPGSAVLKKPEILIRPVSRKGFGMSIIGSFGQTTIKDQNLETLSMEQDLHSWNTSPLYGFIGAIGISYYLDNNIYFRSGIEYNKYSSKFNLTGKYTDNILSTDANSSMFYKIIDASFDSVLTINYITLPLLAGYTSGKPEKLGFYAEGGFKISIPQKATYKNSGIYNYSGYYPSNPVVLQYLNIPELGFYTKENISKTGDIKMKGINIAFYASAGVNIPLGYYSSVTIGPEAIIGLSDILSENKTYTDIFGKSYSHQTTRIRSIGLKICVAYKL